MERHIYSENDKVTLYEILPDGNTVERLFTICTLIGQGGSCVAYKAQSDAGISVKLKQLSPANIVKPEKYEKLKSKFLNAYDTQISLLNNDSLKNSVAGITALYQDGNGLLWYSVSDSNGKTLDKVIQEGPLFYVLDKIKKLCEYVRSIHEAGWLLIDLKPENVLVIDSTGLTGIVLFDFDSFVSVDELKGDGEVLLSGTKEYSAPEVMEKRLSEIGPKSDYYSLGIIVYEALFSGLPGRFSGIGASNYIYDFSGNRYELSLIARNLATEFLNSTLVLDLDCRYQSDSELINGIIALAAKVEPPYKPILAVCPFCGKDTDINLRFCQSCGHDLLDKVLTCRNTKCRMKNPKGNLFCQYCGTALDEDELINLCPSCLRASKKTQKFCIYCGASINGKCPKCGRSCSIEDSFCIYCGERLKQ